VEAEQTDSFWPQIVRLSNNSLKPSFGWSVESAIWLHLPNRLQNPQKKNLSELSELLGSTTSPWQEHTPPNLSQARWKTSGISVVAMEMGGCSWFEKKNLMENYLHCHQPYPLASETVESIIDFWYPNPTTQPTQPRLPNIQLLNLSFYSPVQKLDSINQKGNKQALIT
jgi:hypothetical protein